MIDGDRIRNARHRLGLSNAADLAKKLGVTPSSVRQWENGSNRPLVDKWEAIAQALEVTVSYLEGKETYELAHFKFLGIAIPDSPMLISKRIPLVNNISDILDIILLKKRGGNVTEDWRGGWIEHGSIDGDFIYISKDNYNDIKVGDILCCFIQEPRDGETVICERSGTISICSWPCEGVTPMAVVKHFVRNL